MSEIGNKKLEQAIERAFEKNPDDNGVLVSDAAAIAKVAWRWYGDDAIRVLEKSLELARAGV